MVLVEWEVGTKFCMVQNETESWEPSITFICQGAAIIGHCAVFEIWAITNACPLKETIQEWSEAKYWYRKCPKGRTKNW
jgi:hypothetical protein